MMNGKQGEYYFLGVRIVVKLLKLHVCKGEGGGLCKKMGMEI